jgi:hypothetical protein
VLLSWPSRGEARRFGGFSWVYHVAFGLDCMFEIAALADVGC